MSRNFVSKKLTLGSNIRIRQRLMPLKIVLA